MLSLYLPWNRLWSLYENKHKYYNNNNPDMYFLRYVCCLFVLFGLFIVAVLVCAIDSKWTVYGITKKQQKKTFSWFNFETNAWNVYISPPCFIFHVLLISVVQ